MNHGVHVTEAETSASCTERVGTVCHAIHKQQMCGATDIRVAAAVRCNVAVRCCVCQSVRFCTALRYCCCIRQPKPCAAASAASVSHALLHPPIMHCIRQPSCKACGTRWTWCVHGLTWYRQQKNGHDAMMQHDAKLSSVHAAKSNLSAVEVAASG
jgi:hypothetical protein